MAVAAVVSAVEVIGGPGCGVAVEVAVVGGGDAEGVGPSHTHPYAHGNLLERVSE